MKLVCSSKSRFLGNNSQAGKFQLAPAYSTTIVEYAGLCRMIFVLPC